MFEDEDFQFELANFLSLPSAVDSDLPCLPRAHHWQQYMTPLLTGIMRGFDHAADVPRITKRVHDDVGLPPRSVGRAWDVWRRSPLWLLIRVAIQTSVDRSSLGRDSYKQFMLYFICTLARDGKNANVSSDLLHLMTSKIIRRLSKLGSTTPDWLCEMALKTCTGLSEILDAGWKQLSARPSVFRNPSQDELIRDTQLSLLDSREYIRNVLANPDPQLLGTPFHPSHHRRGTIEDFLSSNGSFFEKAYAVDPDVTLYDVERSVEEGIDDWCACVTNVDEACAQLEILMDRYMMKADKACTRRLKNPEDMSARLLTVIQLYVALDKLVVKEIPMLADYPPEIPVAFLERLLLRKTTSLHRLSCAYQYLSARHSRSRPGWSLLSNEFTEDSFPVRYYDQSLHLQQLKARIEDDVTKKVSGRAGSQLEDDEYQEYQQHLPRRRLAESAEVSQSPLPTLLLHAKVVVFELQCPACIRIWRAAAPRILYHFYPSSFGHRTRDSLKGGRHLLARFPALEPYLVERQGPPLRIQIHFAYFNPEGELQSQNAPIFRYLVQYPRRRSHQLSLKTGHFDTSLQDLKLEFSEPWSHFSIWKPGRRYDDWELSSSLTEWFFLPPSFPHPSCAGLGCYVRRTSHTPNHVLSAQARCPADLSLDEFIAFAHLRSGSSLQWLNILQGLRSRTLNLRRHQFYLLLANGAFQVGPLDLNTGTWIWHQELQDSCFCNALLNELDSLFVDVAGLIDRVLMSTISLLLTRVLASSPSKGVSDRAIALLRSVRRKTFGWVLELSYDLAKEPTNQGRRNLLVSMAVTCRNTFDVDPATLHKVIYSAEDVDALLSCSFFIHALRPICKSNS